jgi:diguanylate cyclase (GGDEF)-like protein
MLSYLSVFLDAQLSSMPELGHLMSVTVVGDRPGDQVVWAGCGKHLCSWPVGHEDAVTQWSLDKGIAETRWQSVVLDGAGTLWAVGEHQVAALLRGATRFVDRNLPDRDLDSVSRQTPVIVDRLGRAMIPTKEGLARWEGAGWRLIGPANGLRSNHITGLALDAAGDLWLGSLGRGLYHWIGYEDWEGWGDGQGLPSAVVWAVLPSREGRTFVGTEDGPGWIDLRGGSAGPLFAGHSWTFGQVSTMGLDRDGSLWAGTFTGAILRIDPRTGRTEQTAKLPAFILTSFEDSSGHIFFSTKQGLYMRDSSSSPGSTPEATPQRVTALDPLLGDSARVEAGCEAPQGVDWFLSNNRFVRFKAGAWTAPAIDGLPELRGSMLSLSCAQNGALWVTGDDGTWRITPGGDRLQAWQLEVPTELRPLAPLAVLADHRGWVWVGTDSGLVVWNGHDWRHLTQESGLIWDDVNQGGISADPDGSLWVGTSGGVAHLLHPEHVFDPVPLDVAVTEIRHGNEILTGAQQISLPWGGPPLRFQLSSPATRNRSELILKIRLVGLHRDWIETQDGVGLFSNLPPGAYTFEAMARNPALNASSAVGKVQVQILPPWWRTNWFTALCLLGILLLLVVGDRLRARNLRARSRELESLVRERTRELEDSRELLHIQATHDGLTGMLNRVAILRALATEIDRARRKSSTLVVALVDLDHFKRVNDAYGHLTGDEALLGFASAIANAIRAYDFAGRYGGEEFLLVLNDIPPGVVEQRLASLHASISNLEVVARGTELTLSCSLGATVFDPACGLSSVEALLSIADQALYYAKAGGRNRVVIRTAIDANAGHENPAAPIA